jgi:hypothetical protein
MSMTDDTYERLLLFLTEEDELVPALDQDTVNGMVVEAASLLSDLRAASGDLAGAAIWQQIAVDSGQVHDDVELDETSRKTR